MVFQLGQPLTGPAPMNVKAGNAASVPGFRLGEPIDNPPAPAEPKSDFPGGFREMGSALVETPRQAVGAAASAVRAGEDLEKPGLLNDLVDWSRKGAEAAMNEKGAADENTVFIDAPGIGPITYKDIRQLPQNLGYSLVSAAAGLGAGIPVGLAPVPGARPAAWAAGTGAAGVAAYRMAKDQIVSDVRDVLNQKSIQDTGNPVSDADWQTVRADIEGKAQKYGLWEAIPEALSEAAGLKIIRMPIGKFMELPGMRNVLSRAATKFAGILGIELGTETATQVGQGGIEAEMGLRDKAPSAGEAFKEVAPQVTLLTGVMAGAGAVGSKVYDRATGGRETEPAPTPQPEVPGTVPAPSPAAAVEQPGRPVEPTPGAEASPAQASAPGSLIPAPVRDLLAGLGYSGADIAAMSTEEANTLVSSETAKEERQGVVTPEKPQVEALGGQVTPPEPQVRAPSPQVSPETISGTPAARPEIGARVKVVSVEGKPLGEAVVRGYQEGKRPRVKLEGLERLGIKQPYLDRVMFQEPAAGTPTMPQEQNSSAPAPGTAAPVEPAAEPPAVVSPPSARLPGATTPQVQETIPGPQPSPEAPEEAPAVDGAAQAERGGEAEVAARADIDAIDASGNLKMTDAEKAQALELVAGGLSPEDAVAEVLDAAESPQKGTEGPPLLDETIRDQTDLEDFTKGKAARPAPLPTEAPGPAVPKDARWINTTGDVVTGDVIRFEEGVFGGSFRKPKFLGNRTVTAQVVRDSYGTDKQQHTFTLKVLASEGMETLTPGTETRRKGRNVYRNGTMRLPWKDESGGVSSARKAQADEKHQRGDVARKERDERKGFYARPQQINFTQDQRDRFYDNLRSQLDRYGLSDVALKLRDRMEEAVNGKASPIWGYYENGVIRVALEGSDPNWVLRHESIHALRDLGLFTKTEWSILEKAARADEPRIMDIKERYPELDGEARIEEAVADMFADWGRAKTPIFRRIAQKIRRFFRALKSAFKSVEIDTPEDIFGRIEAGGVGGRAGTSLEAVQEFGKKFAAAYHGSPYDFDRFTTEKIGTGEGAQAYGWGLYFAGKKEIAEYYRKATSRERAARETTAREILARHGLPDASDGAVHEALHLGFRLRDGEIDIAEAAKNLGYRSPDVRQNSVDREAALREIAAMREGRLYEVDLAPQEDEYLYWDKPLIEQSKGVQAAIYDMFHNVDNPNYIAAPMPNLMPGFNVYKTISRALGRDDKAASLALKDAGIPGIKYKDASSRDRPEVVYTVHYPSLVNPGSEQTLDFHDEAEARKFVDEKPGSRITESRGTYNYVIFDESRVKVTAKFALPREQSAGEHEATIGRIMGTTDKPVSQRLRELVAAWKDRGALSAKQGFLDRSAVVEDYEMAEFGELLGAEQSAFKATHMTQNLQSVMAAVLRHGPLKVKNGWFQLDEEFGKGFEDIFKPLADAGTLRLWKGWAIANRANRLMQEGREHLLTEAEIAELLPLGDQHPEFRKVMDEWTAFNQKMLDMAEAAGLISAKQRGLWEKSDYVPFYRILEDEDTVKAARSGRRGLEGQRSGIRALKGGESKINDPLENMVMSMTSLVDRSFKNLAMQKVVALAERVGAMERVGPEFQPTLIGADEATRKLKQRFEDRGLNFDVLSADDKAQFVEMFRLTAPQGPDIVSVMVAGKPIYYRVGDPLLMRAVASLDTNTLDGIMKAFRMAKRILTEGVTIDPAFMLANAIRDTLSAWVIYGGKGLRPGIDAIKGFHKALRGDPSIARIMAAGGGSGGFYRTEASDVRKLMDARIKGVDRNTIVDSPKKAWELWHRIGQASEAANRIAVAEAARKNGASDAEAAYQALDLMDFSMRGDYAAVRVLTEMVPFMNARIQGIYRLYRGARDNPQGFLLRGSAIAAATLALLAANWDREEYQALEDWDKDTYYHVWAGGRHFRIPKPFEAGAIFSTIPERMIRFLAGMDDGDKAAKRVLAMFADTFAMSPVPQLFKPGVEQWSNKVSFTGRPIVSEGLDRLTPDAQWNPWTSETARMLGRAMPEFMGEAGSPQRIEHLVRGYFGALGSYVLAASDQVVRLFGDFPPRPDRRLEDIPVIGRFMREDPARTTVYMTDFYELQREAGRLLNTVRELQRRGMEDEAQALLRAKGDKIAVARGINRAATQMSEINRAIRFVENNRGMSAAEKRRQLDRLAGEKNRIARVVMQKAPAIGRLAMQEYQKGDAEKMRDIAENGGGATP